MGYQGASYLKRRNNAWQGMAKNLAPGYPTTISDGKERLKITTSENWGTNSTILNHKITTNFFIFYMITLKTAQFSRYEFSFICFWSDYQKHSFMLNSKFLLLCSKKCGNGNVSKVGAFLLITPIYDKVFE